VRRENLIFLFVFLFHYSRVTLKPKSTLPTTKAAPDEDENELTPHSDPLPQRGEEKINKRIKWFFLP
jgi:hypothetical protein